MYLTKRECYAPLSYTLLLLDYFQAKKNCLWPKHVTFAFWYLGNSYCRFILSWETISEILQNKITYKAMGFQQLLRPTPPLVGRLLCRAVEALQNTVTFLVKFISFDNLI